MADKIDEYQLKYALKNKPTEEVLKLLTTKHKKELLASRLMTELPVEEVMEVADKVDQEILPLKETFEGYFSSLGDGSRKYEGLETGISEIDELIGGLSRFVLMAGMGGVGKSTLALQMALGVCEIEKIPVIYYSFEMSRRDVITMALQNRSNKKLFRADLELNGFSPNLPDEKKQEIDNAREQLDRVAELFYIVDASEQTPDLLMIKSQIIALKEKHKTKDVLVVIDSVQDIVPIELNQVQAEAQTCQRLVELQQETNATILAVAQKNKSGVREGGGYASVMGSVAFIHKPTTVIELIGGQEALNQMKKNSKDTDEIKKFEQELEEGTQKPNNPYPIYLRVIKGRNSGYGGIPLKYYGAYRLYEVGEANRHGEIYDQMREVGLV